MSDLEIIFKIIVFCGGGFLTLVFSAVTWWLLKTNPNEYKKMQKISPSFKEIILGCGSKFNGQITHRQKVFPVVNLETNQWEARTNINESSIDEFLKK